MAETAAGGWVRRAARSAARTRPCACASGTSTIESGSASATTRCNASATLSNAAIDLRSRPEQARLAAAFLVQADTRDAHSAIYRFHHVVDRETGDGHCGQRFHFDPGVAFDLHGRPDNEARQLRVG